MFEVDEEIANESQTVKNMIEGERDPSLRLRSFLQRWPRFSLLSSTLIDVVSITDTGTEDIIPLPNVPGKILAKVIEYCKFHVEANKKVDDKPAKSEDDIKQWDTEFVKVDQATLFDLILVSQVAVAASHQGSCSKHRSTPCVSCRV